MHISGSTFLSSTTVRVPSLLDPLVRFQTPPFSLGLFHDIRLCITYTESMVGRKLTIE
jgi:hypothetical protein